MKLARTLASLFSSSSQFAKWLPLRAATAHQVYTAAAAESAPRKGTRSVRDQFQPPQASAQPSPSKKKGEPETSPMQAPAEVVGEVRKEPQLKKPREIPWQTKVANSVHLIGRLGAPVQFGVSPDGIHTAASVLLQEKTRDLPQFWIPIVFQGDLAQIAVCNLREKDHVYVTGQLTGGPQSMEDDDTTKLQVMVDNISYVLRLHPEKTCGINSGMHDSTSVEANDSSSSMQSWTDFFANPEKWWDNRQKGNNKCGTFKHKATGELLEINESTPEWVLAKLDVFPFNSETPNISGQCSNPKKSQETLESSWNDLLENPHSWWDNRKDKLNGKMNPKRPDFSHKVSNKALWLDSAPGWILPKLKDITSNAESCWQSEAKKIDTKGTKKEESWRSLLTNPDKWWDKRSNKSKPNAPDFKHKETGEALWLDSTTTPKWALDKFSCGS